MTPDEVLRFWFGELRPAQWFKADAVLDAEIARRFENVHRVLASRVPDDWRATGRDILAAVIVLDQFPRNMFRETPRAFATDAVALAIAEEAVERRLDEALTTEERKFLYLPFEHAEDRSTQARSVALFEALGEPSAVDYARRHRDIIERFGRFPHRNAILGRASTADELEFLKEPGSWF
jgi:uncharacterized protein (DUF924 family)